MKKRRYLWLTGIAILGLIILSAWWLSGDKPVVYQGKPLPQWAAELTYGPDQAARERARAAFLDMGSNAVPSLIKLLRTPEPLYQRGLIKLVGKLPPVQSQAIFSRLKLVNIPGVRLTGARGLECLGPISRPAIPALAKALHDENAGVRAGAAQALAKIGEPSVPVLIVTLADKNADVRWISATALGLMGTNAQTTAPLLVRAMGDKVDYVRTAAAQSLTLIGPASGPALVRAIEQERGPARQIAAFTVARLVPRPPEASAALVKMLEDPDAESRSAAIRVLTLLRPPQPEAVAAVMHALQDTDPQVRLAATQTFSDFAWRRRSVSVAPTLIALLQDKDAAQREWSARALGYLGAPASNAIPRITELQQDADPNVRVAASNALGQINAALEARQ